MRSVTQHRLDGGIHLRCLRGSKSKHPWTPGTSPTNFYSKDIVFMTISSQVSYRPLQSPTTNIVSVYHLTVNHLNGARVTGSEIPHYTFNFKDVIFSEGRTPAMVWCVVEGRIGRERSV